MKSFACSRVLPILGFVLIAAGPLRAAEQETITPDTRSEDTRLNSSHPSRSRMPSSA